MSDFPVAPLCDDDVTFLPVDDVKLGGLELGFSVEFTRICASSVTWVPEDFFDSLITFPHFLMLECIQFLDLEANIATRIQQTMNYRRHPVQPNRHLQLASHNYWC